MNDCGRIPQRKEEVDVDEKTATESSL